MSVTSPYDLLDGVAAALLADAWITAYVAATWPGKTLDVHTDVDRENLPELGGAPMIILDVEDRVITEDFTGARYLAVLCVSARGTRKKLDGLARLAAKRAARSFMEQGAATSPESVHPDNRWNEDAGAWYGFSVVLHDPV